MLRYLIATACLLPIPGCTDPFVNTAIAQPAPISERPERAVDQKPIGPGEAEPVEQEKPVGEIKMAKCRLVAIGDNKVFGLIHFKQVGEEVQIWGSVSGLTPGKHGFHVHEKGDISDTKTGKSTGGHFNPTNKKHGRPHEKERHVGDLGNITADTAGMAKVSIIDSVISLNGENSILGRSIVVHAGEDKFTQPTGDAGARVAFGLITPDTSGKHDVPSEEKQ